MNWLSPSEGGLVSLRGSKNENLGDKNLYSLLKYYSFPGGSEDKESAFSTGDPGLIPRLGRSPAEGNGNPLQYSHLENSMDRGAWWATVHGVSKSILAMESYSAFKRKEILMNATARVNLSEIMPSEIRQTRKDKYYCMRFLE